MVVGLNFCYLSFTKTHFHKALVPDCPASKIFFQIVNPRTIRHLNNNFNTFLFVQAHQSIREKFHSTTVHAFIEKSLEFCLEKRLEEIKLVGLLFSSLCKYYFKQRSPPPPKKKIQNSGFRIRIDCMRIRILKIWSVRIRIRILPDPDP